MRGQTFNKVIVGMGAIILSLCLFCSVLAELGQAALLVDDYESGDEILNTVDKPAENGEDASSDLIIGSEAINNEDEDKQGDEEDDSSSQDELIKVGVSVTVNLRSVFYEGDDVLLEASAYGINEEQEKLIYIWQCDDGALDKNGVPIGWRDVEWGNKSSVLHITATEDNFSASWRVVISVEGKEYTAKPDLKHYYKVVFITEDGDRIDRTLYVEAGMDITAFTPMAPEREGLKHSGWESANDIDLTCITGRALFTPVYVNVMIEEAIQLTDGENQQAGLDLDTNKSDLSEDTEKLTSIVDEESYDTGDDESSFVDDEEAEKENAQHEEPETERSIQIERIMPDVIFYGDTFYLVATLVGYEDDTVSLIWEKLTPDGWIKVDGGGTLLAVVADEHTVNCSWRAYVID